MCLHNGGNQYETEGANRYVFYINVSVCVCAQKWFSCKSFSQVSWHSSLSLPFPFLLYLHPSFVVLTIKSFTESLYHFFSSLLFSFLFVLTWILMGILKYGEKVKRGQNYFYFAESIWTLFRTEFMIRYRITHNK